MFKHTLFATLAAGILATAALPTGALAQAPETPRHYGSGWGGGIQFGGPDWSVQFGTYPQSYCRPIVQKVKWWDEWGYPHWSDVVVGQNCRHPRPHWGGWGWGGWNNQGTQGGWSGDDGVSTDDGSSGAMESGN